ncbi:hypothetical protein D3OALGB2SA_3610 [Olavius algarvensis associated proteobacterium Delta 3]|nr:hypothetical protein D3OALGB2SA_3610 [Olavius algarvensis associated proteobacterium Delta 3]
MIRCPEYAPPAPAIRRTVSMHVSCEWWLWTPSERQNAFGALLPKGAKRGTFGGPAVVTFRR